MNQPALLPFRSSPSKPRRRIFGPFARRLVERFPDWPRPNIRQNMPGEGQLADLLSQIAPGDDHLCRRVVDNLTRLYRPETLA